MLPQLIGHRAERLAWIFCVVDRSTVDSSLEISCSNNGDQYQYQFTSREELGSFPIKLNGDNCDDYFIFIVLLL